MLSGIQILSDFNRVGHSIEFMKCPLKYTVSRRDYLSTSVLNFCGVCTAVVNSDHFSLLDDKNDLLKRFIPTFTLMCLAIIAFFLPFYSLGLM